MPATKKCDKCKQMLSRDDFWNRAKGTYDGKWKICKYCSTTNGKKQKRKPMKPCNKCGIEKKLTAFHRSAVNPDGRQYTCKDCRSLRYDVTDVVTHCSNCVFERECKNNINFKDWQPYCHAEAKYHEFYVREYGQHRSAAGVAQA